MDGESLAIDLRRVEKIYRGRVHALQSIDLQVRRGEVFGLLGPNGAGKSTLVKIIMSIVRPTRAEGTILGHPVGHKPTLERIGYLPENHCFPEYLTGRQTLEFFGALSKVGRRRAETRASELLETVGMTAWADRKVSNYSKGMMQRIGLAQSLMSDPDLVVLDEPTDGVDPVGRRDIRDVLARLRDRGKTVFVNSHLLAELEMVCERIAILVGGTVARQGTIAELTAAKQRYEIEVESNGSPLPIERAINGLVRFDATPLAPAPPLPPASYPAGAPAPPLARLIRSGKLGTGEWFELEGTILRVGSTESAAVQPLLDRLRAAGFVIRRLQSVRPSLQDLFFDAVTDPTTGATVRPGAELGGRLASDATPGSDA